MVRKNYKDESRKDYGRSVADNEGISSDELQSGALMRIADATEAMAKNWNQLISDRDMYKRWYTEQLQRSQQLARSNISLRGAITKLKKKIANL